VVPGTNNATSCTEYRSTKTALFYCDIFLMFRLKNASLRIKIIDTDHFARFADSAYINTFATTLSKR